MQHSCLLTSIQTDAMDKTAIANGTPGIQLMERAGKAVLEEIIKRYAPGPTLILCGPGNNGGDGFVIARLLHHAGWPVTLMLFGDIKSLKGDAALAAAEWKGEVQPWNTVTPAGCALVVDAVFGTGLARPLPEEIERMFSECARRSIPVLAVDIPSGISGNTGQALGKAPQAAVTVTFTTKKHGHLLFPGRAYCGEIIVADIGLTPPEGCMDVNENTPALWQPHWPKLEHGMHKYSRGHALILGGKKETAGAARLSAKAALRVGAGLVSLICDEDAWPAYKDTEYDALMLRLLKSPSDWQSLLQDERNNAFVIGPGYGVGEKTRNRVLEILSHKKSAVLDADALTSFADNPSGLFKAVQSPCILTPHEGEFKKLFNSLSLRERDGVRDISSKVSRAQEAAKASHATIILKGADTVIASPDGRAAINSNAPPTLATAGAGDVLSGICGGLLARSMPPFEAACAAVWIHGEAANRIGTGLIADDIPAMLPAILKTLEHHERAGS